MLQVLPTYFFGLLKQWNREFIIQVLTDLLLLWYKSLCSFILLSFYDRNNLYSFMQFAYLSIYSDTVCRKILPHLIYPLKYIKPCISALK